MKCYFRKQPNSCLCPDDDPTTEYMTKLKVGDVVSAEIKRPRNYEFHKRYFALLQLGFDYFEPEYAEYKGEQVEKNFNRFRHDITILSGYFDMVPDIRGEFHAQAKSISFGSMKQDDFEKLYSKTIDVLLKYVMKTYKDAEEVRIAVDQIMGFA